MSYIAERKDVLQYLYSLKQLPNHFRGAKGVNKNQLAQRPKIRNEYIM